MLLRLVVCTRCSCSCNYTSSSSLGEVGLVGSARMYCSCATTAAARHHQQCTSTVHPMSRLTAVHCSQQRVACYLWQAALALLVSSQLHLCRSTCCARRKQLRHCCCCHAACRFGAEQYIGCTDSGVWQQGRCSAEGQGQGSRQKGSLRGSGLCGARHDVCKWLLSGGMCTRRRAPVQSITCCYINIVGCPLSHANFATNL